MTPRSTLSASGLVIAIDTREQKPYAFPKLQTAVVTLATGDYSIVGYEEQVAVERKSKADAYATFGGGHKRFVKELVRLADIPTARVLIECSCLEFVESPPPYTRVKGEALLKKIRTWEMKYGVAFTFVPNRAAAKWTVERWLQAWWKYHGKDGA